MFLIYDFLLMVYGVVTLPLLAAKGKLREGFGRRQGFLPQGDAKRLSVGEVVWIHAVSVGEVRLALRLIERLREHRPGLPVVLTTTTASSQKIAREAVGSDVVVTYCPFDLSWMMRRFIDTVRPRVIVVLETEVWPNMLRLAERRKIPVLIVNARLSDRAFPIYQAWKVVLGSIFKRITRCLAQSDEHGERFGALGVPAARIRVTGNMKFDLEAAVVSEPIQRAMNVFRGDSRLLFLAASTHPGEEEQVLKAFAGVRKRVSGAKLVIAPRHLERLDEVEKSILATGLKCARISQLECPCPSTTDVLIVDEWGVLNQLYPLVDVVFVGGSLVPAGGHNLAEPAVAGCPILYGPWTRNFKDMEEEFSGAGAGARVQNALELEGKVIELFEDAAMRRSLAERSRAVVAKNAGATDRNVEEILTWFSKK